MTLQEQVLVVLFWFLCLHQQLYVS